jgi:hypothetical protein
MLTAEIVRDLFDYDPAGHLRWRRPAGRGGRYPVGSIAGYVDVSTGYWFIEIMGRKCRLHRLVWLHQTGAWPKNDLDHRDLNRGNNAIDNLREATDLENAKNKRLQRNNKFGVKGISFRPACKLRPYEVYVRSNGKRVYIGNYATLEDAAAARSDAARRLHGEFARDG